MPRRKKVTIKRTRRSPYERSLEYAAKRLEKALTEQMHHQACLEALNQEIPYLQTVIRALTPPEETPAMPAKPYTPAATVVNQEDYLKRFIKPIPLTAPKPLSQEGVVTDPSEPFIADIVPGTELLP